MSEKSGPDAPANQDAPRDYEARDRMLRADTRVREAVREGNEALARGESTVYESGEVFIRDFDATNALPSNESVEAACEAHFLAKNGYAGWQTLLQPDQDEKRKWMRAALEAAHTKERSPFNQEQYAAAFDVLYREVRDDGPREKGVAAWTPSVTHMILQGILDAMRGVNQP